MDPVGAIAKNADCHVYHRTGDDGISACVCYC